MCHYVCVCVDEWHHAEWVIVKPLLGLVLIHIQLPSYYLRQQREDGDASMPTNHGHIHQSHVEVFLLSYKCVGTDNIKGGDAHELTSIIDTSSLEDFCSNGDGRVDGIGDDVDESLGVFGCFVWMCANKLVYADVRMNVCVCVYVHSYAPQGMAVLYRRWKPHAGLCGPSLTISPQ